jgi:putative nucleotidyltransferase with HDIG domain
VSEPARFLISVGQALAKITLYADGHPSRARATEQAFEMLRQLQVSTPRPVFSFVGREAIFQRSALRELSDWDWAERLSAAGVQRLEFEKDVSPEDFLLFLEEVAKRVALTQSSWAGVLPGHPTRSAPIRFGAIGVRDFAENAATSATRPDENPDPNGEATDLSEEADAVSWMHEEVKDRLALPVGEAGLVVTSLAHTMRQSQRLLLPLLTLKEYDQYTTTHALNVSVLAMGLAERLGLSGREVRAYGMAGLLHDVGKVRVPREILRKSGPLEEDEKAIVRQHPLDGAQIILRGCRRHEICAVVAYEHHMMIDRGGYPVRREGRDCHHASVLVHVCDVFDALRTNRPYRAAWPTADILGYIERRAGTEFDPDLAHAFIKMMKECEPRAAGARVLEDKRLAEAAPDLERA